MVVVKHAHDTIYLSLANSVKRNGQIDVSEADCANPIKDLQQKLVLLPTFDRHRLNIQ